MFQKILLATDGSPHADRAAEETIGLVRHLPNFQLTLFHVTLSVERSQLLKNNLKSSLIEEAHQAIIRTEYRLNHAGIPYELNVALGDPAEEIIRKVEQEAYDLVIIGSRGLSKIKGLLLGSVSQQVLHKVKCPVMIVK
jgi:nucleotide-binding universal stress UspA family protein